MCGWYMHSKNVCSLIWECFGFVKNMVCYTDQSAGSADKQENLFIKVMLTSSLHSYFESDSMAKKRENK